MLVDRKFSRNQVLDEKVGRMLQEGGQGSFSLPPEE